MLRLEGNLTLRDDRLQGTFSRPAFIGVPHIMHLLFLAIDFPLELFMVVAPSRPTSVAMPSR